MRGVLGLNFGVWGGTREEICQKFQFRLHHGTIRSAESGAHGLVDAPCTRLCLCCCWLLLVISTSSDVEVVHNILQHSR